MFVESVRNLRFWRNDWEYHKFAGFAALVVMEYNKIESRQHKNLFQKSVLVDLFDFLPAGVPSAAGFIDPSKDNSWS